MQHGIDIGASGAKSWREAGGNRGEDHRCERVDKNSPIKTETQPNRNVGQMGGAGKITQARAKRYSGNSTEQGREQRFRKHLSQQARACAAESSAKGHLALTNRSARHENVRNVGAGQQ